MSDIDYLVRRDYEAVGADHPEYPLKRWEYLTEEEKNFLREEYRRYSREMNDLANLISESKKDDMKLAEKLLDKSLESVAVMQKAFRKHFPE